MSQGHLFTGPLKLWCCAFSDAGLESGWGPSSSTQKAEHKNRKEKTRLELSIFCLSQIN